MLSIDPNILLYAYSSVSPLHTKAQQFLQSLANNHSVGISEFALAEFYLLLRNPAVLTKSLTAAAATEVIQNYRHHPAWQIFGYPGNSLKLHNELWQKASEQNFARRRLFDARMALTLRHFGVTEFATCNPGDFEGFGFQRVWNPLS
ncbi:MAG: VapC toxin family PIN domain ribonuclease [Blastochloris sp.]|nr:VapC toxin family PIN domain ribonuclease [Blastochloris sp.]